MLSTYATRSTTLAPSFGSFAVSILVSALVIFLIFVFFNSAFSESIYGSLFSVNDLRLLENLIVFVIVLFPAFFVVSHKQPVSAPILQMIYLWNFCPVSIGNAILNADFSNALWINTFLCIAFILTTLIAQMKIKSLRFHFFSRANFFSFIAILTLLTAALVYWVFGTPTLSFNYLTLYSARSEFSEARSENSLFLAATYLVYWLAICVFPVAVSTLETNKEKAVVFSSYFLFCI